MIRHQKCITEMKDFPMFQMLIEVYKRKPDNNMFFVFIVSNFSLRVYKMCTTR